MGDTFIPYRGTAVMLAYNSETVPNPPRPPMNCTSGFRTIPAALPTATPPPAAPATPLWPPPSTTSCPTRPAPPDTKWETEHTQEWDNAFDLMAQLHPSLYQTAGKVQYPMKNAGSLDLLATQQIDMTPAFVNMVLSQKNMGTLPDSIKLQAIEPAFSGALAGFCIPTIAKDQEAALSVIDFYLSYEAQAIDWNTMYASP